MGVVRQAGFALALMFMTAASFSSAEAQPADWPSKPVRLVVPYPAGGGADNVARDMADYLSKRWGQQVVIDNRAGASGTIGTTFVAKAAPDGTTFVLIQAGPTTAFLTRKDLPYHPVNDFTPIILLGRTPTVLTVVSTSNLKTLGEVIAAAKENPGKLTYGSPGIGTPGHIAAEMFQMETGTKLVHVPFNGSSQIIANILGGQINLSFDTVSSDAELIRAGQLRPFIVSSNVRSQAIPDVPIGSEQGIKGWESYTYYGLAGPKGTSRDVVDRMNAAVTEYIKSEAGTKRLNDLGVLPQRGGTPEQLQEFLSSELVRLAPIIKSANIRTD